MLYKKIMLLQYVMLTYCYRNITILPTEVTDVKKLLTAPEGEWIMNVHTIRTYANAIKRSQQFVRHAIRLGKIKAEQLDNRWLIPKSEERRFKNEPFQITRMEMGQCGQK